MYRICSLVTRGVSVAVPSVSPTHGVVAGDIRPHLLDTTVTKLCECTDQFSLALASVNLKQISALKDLCLKLSSDVDIDL